MISVGKGRKRLSQKSLEDRSQPFLLPSLALRAQSAQNGRPEIVVFCVGCPFICLTVQAFNSDRIVAAYLTLEYRLSLVIMFH